MDIIRYEVVTLGLLVNHPPYVQLVEILAQEVTLTVKILLDGSLLRGQLPHRLLPLLVEVVPHTLKVGVVFLHVFAQVGMLGVILVPVGLVRRIYLVAEYARVVGVKKDVHVIPILFLHHHPQLKQELEHTAIVYSIGIHPIIPKRLAED